jgi:predicted enzyme related to lactoylglutathione lyase
MITHVTLTTLPVRDQDRALDFFVGKLGMKVRTDQPYGPAGRWIEVAPDDTGAGIVLSKVDDDAAYAQPLTNVLLGCDDAAVTAAQLRAAGVEVTEPETQSWGTFLLVTEPDGRQICITQNDSIKHHA